MREQFSWRALLCSGVSATAIGLASTPVLAQGTEATTAPPAVSPTEDVPITAAPVSETPTASKPKSAAVDEPVTEIVVTGFRASLNTALNQKKRESGVVDVIKAEDIADFPDTNLAESIQRVPGVSISRVGGEGKSITVRGLGPQFTRVRINGMEAQSAAGGTTSDRGANNGRGFAFNTFASELFNSIAVRKTQAAEVVEGSLGATVDLTVARPFDYKGFNFVASGQNSFNSLSETNSPRVTALISNIWGDFGALASVAYTKRKYYEEVFGSGGWNPATADGGFCTPFGRVNNQAPASGMTPGTNVAQGTDANNCATGVPRQPANDTYYDMVNQTSVFLPRLPRYGRYVHDQTRLGASGSFQWKPSDATSVSFDVLYSDYDVTREESWLEGFSFARAISQNGKPQTAIRNAVIQQFGTSPNQPNSGGAEVPVYDILRGEFSGVDVKPDLARDEWRSQFTQFTLNGKHELNDALTISGIAGYSNNDYAQPITTLILFQRPNAGMTMDFSDRDRPIFTHDFDVTDYRNYQFNNGNAEIRMTPQWVENTYKTGEANLAWKMVDGVTAKFGARYTDFQFGSRQYNRPNNFTVPDLTTDQLGQVTTLLTDFGKGGLGGRFPSSWVMLDYDKFADLTGLNSGTGIYSLVGPEDIANGGTARAGTRGVTEKTRALYHQIDFNFDSLPVVLRGDVGIRYSRTDQSSWGYAVAGATAVERVEAKRHYDEWLPSANLVAELTPEVLMRASVSKVIVRPDYSFLNPGGSVVLSGTPNISSGNPNLNPIRAWAYDLSAEWYFTRESLIGLGLFYKDISSYIQNRPVSMKYTETGLPLELLGNSGVDPVNTDITVNTPLNTPGGPLKGFEVNYQQSFSFLPGWMSNFGLLLNYTWVDSKIDYFLAGNVITTNDLLGLSKNAYNGTLYWENKKFSARISAAYRDKFLEALPANNPYQDVEGTDEMLTFDTSTSYNLDKHWKVSLEGLNILDRYKRQYIDSDRDSTFVYGHTGATWNLGVQYKF